MLGECVFSLVPKVFRILENWFFAGQMFFYFFLFFLFFFFFFFLFFSIFFFFSSGFLLDFYKRNISGFRTAPSPFPAAVLMDAAWDR